MPNICQPLTPAPRVVLGIFCLGAVLALSLGVALPATQAAQQVSRISCFLSYLLSLATNALAINHALWYHALCHHILCHPTRFHLLSDSGSLTLWALTLWLSCSTGSLALWALTLWLSDSLALLLLGSLSMWPSCSLGSHYLSLWLSCSLGSHSRSL